MSVARTVLAALAVLAATTAAGADAGKGAAIYSRCAACHALAYDRTGPRHCRLVGRKAAAIAGFEYSEAMRRSGLVWDAPTLDRFLADPMKAVPGTSMGYAGVKDPRERADLIAYLRIAGAAGSRACRGG